MPDAQMLHTAVRELSNVIVYDIFSPPQASRVYAYASIAAYEALRQGNPEYRTLAGQLRRKVGELVVERLRTRGDESRRPRTVAAAR